MGEADNWIWVAAVSDVAKGTAIPVEIMGMSLAVYHLDDGSVWVTDNICTHAFALLTDGWLEDGVIECPLHAGQFDVRTGKGMGPPIDDDLRTFKVRVDGGAIMIELPA
jgi:nitrite reductase/ring-hydroxylating ferredoxin subunit